MSSAQTSDSTTSVANMLHPVDFLTQHDARLDILVTKITSALQSSEKSPEGLATHALKLSTEATTTVAASRDLLSRAFHKAALILLRGGHGKDSETRMHAFDVSLALVDAAIDLLPTKRIDTRLPLSLLEVIFSFHTQAELASRVSTIRRRYEAIRASQSERVADLYIIKSVMSCINRDQSGSNPVLSGRLRLMLAASLPVWHPSGMNRRAQYNISNAPDYENVLKNEDTSDVDVALYKAFWRAQELVGNPSLSESPAVWQEAYVSMDRVLCAFKSLPAAKEIETCIDVSKEKQQSRIPKFLTSPSILRLQLEDIRIRRHILMQYAIFLHHLESVAGYTLSEKDTPAWKSSVEFCKTLFESGGEGVKLRKQVYDVMNLDSHGKFKRFVLSLLHRERRWMHWKKHTGYTHLVGNKGAAPTIFKRRKVRSRVDEDDVAQRDVRNDWDSRQNAWCVPPPSECAAPLLERARAELWSADVLKMELKEDMEDDEVSEDMKRANDSKYVWRTLRMLCEENIACLASVSNQENGSLDLEALVRCGADANANSNHHKLYQTLLPSALEEVLTICGLFACGCRSLHQNEIKLMMKKSSQRPVTRSQRLKDTEELSTIAKKQTQHSRRKLQLAEKREEVSENTSITSEIPFQNICRRSARINNAQNASSSISKPENSSIDVKLRREFKQKTPASTIVGKAQTSKSSGRLPCSRSTKHTDLNENTKETFMPNRASRPTASPQFSKEKEQKNCELIPNQLPSVDGSGLGVKKTEITNRQHQYSSQVPLGNVGGPELSAKSEGCFKNEINKDTGTSIGKSTSGIRKISNNKNSSIEPNPLVSKQADTENKPVGQDMKKIGGILVKSRPGNNSNSRYSFDHNGDLPNEGDKITSISENRKAVNKTKTKFGAKAIRNLRRCGTCPPRDSEIYHDPETYRGLDADVPEGQRSSDQRVVLGNSDCDFDAQAADNHDLLDDIVNTENELTNFPQFTNTSLSENPFDDGFGDVYDANLLGSNFDSNIRSDFLSNEMGFDIESVLLDRTDEGIGKGVSSGYENPSNVESQHDDRGNMYPLVPNTLDNASPHVESNNTELHNKKPDNHGNRNDDSRLQRNEARLDLENVDEIQAREVEREVNAVEESSQDKDVPLPCEIVSVQVGGDIHRQETKEISRMSPTQKKINNPVSPANKLLNFECEQINETKRFPDSVEILSTGDSNERVAEHLLSTTNLFLGGEKTFQMNDNDAIPAGELPNKANLSNLNRGIDTVIPNNTTPVQEGLKYLLQTHNNQNADEEKEATSKEGIKGFDEDDFIPRTTASQHRTLSNLKNMHEQSARTRNDPVTFLDEFLDVNLTSQPNIMQPEQGQWETFPENAPMVELNHVGNPKITINNHSEMSAIKIQNTSQELGKDRFQKESSLYETYSAGLRPELNTEFTTHIMENNQRNNAARGATGPVIMGQQRDLTGTELNKSVEQIDTVQDDVSQPGELLKFFMESGLVHHDSTVEASERERYINSRQSENISGTRDEVDRAKIGGRGRGRGRVRGRGRGFQAAPQISTDALSQTGVSGKRRRGRPRKNQDQRLPTSTIGGAIHGELPRNSVLNKANILENVSNQSFENFVNYEQRQLPLQNATSTRDRTFSGDRERIKPTHQARNSALVPNTESREATVIQQGQTTRRQSKMGRQKGYHIPQDNNSSALQTTTQPSGGQRATPALPMTSLALESLPIFVGRGFILQQGIQNVPLASDLEKLFKPSGNQTGVDKRSDYLGNLTVKPDEPTVEYIRQLTSGVELTNVHITRFETVFKWSHAWMFCDRKDWHHKFLQMLMSLSVARKLESTMSHELEFALIDTDQLSRYMRLVTRDQEWMRREHDSIYIRSKTARNVGLETMRQRYTQNLNKLTKIADIIKEREESLKKTICDAPRMKMKFSQHPLSTPFTPENQAQTKSLTYTLYCDFAPRIYFHTTKMFLTTQRDIHYSYALEVISEFCIANGVEKGKDMNVSESVEEKIRQSLKRFVKMLHEFRSTASLASVASELLNMRGMSSPVRSIVKAVLNALQRHERNAKPVQVDDGIDELVHDVLHLRNKLTDRTKELHEEAFSLRKEEFRRSLIDEKTFKANSLDRETLLAFAPKNNESYESEV